MTKIPPGLEFVSPEQRRARGLQVYELVTGRPARPPVTRREETLIDFGFAEVWARAFDGVLGMRDRRLLVLSALGSLNAEADLERHIYGAIKSGDLDLAELNECVSHLAGYAGWAVAETADRLVHEQWKVVHEERGETVPPAPSYEPPAEPEDQEARQRHGETHYRLVNWTPTPRAGTPFIADGIIKFMFGKLWSHPGLTRRDRRILTLGSACVAGNASPVHAHVLAALRSGELSYDECHECVLQLGIYAGWPKAALLFSAVEEQSAKIKSMNFAPVTGQAAAG